MTSGIHEIAMALQASENWSDCHGSARGLVYYNHMHHLELRVDGDTAMINGGVLISYSKVSVLRTMIQLSINGRDGDYVPTGAIPL